MATMPPANMRNSRSVDVFTASPERASVELVSLCMKSELIWKAEAAASAIQKRPPQTSLYA